MVLIFKFYHCFTFFKDYPKLMTMLQTDNNHPVIVNGKRKTGIGSSSNCPNGMKKATREKQVNEMVDSVAKKFRVPSLTWWHHWSISQCRTTRCIIQIFGEGWRRHVCMVDANLPWHLPIQKRNKLWQMQ